LRRASVSTDATESVSSQLDYFRRHFRFRRLRQLKKSIFAAIETTPGVTLFTCRLLDESLPQAFIHPESLVRSPLWASEFNRAGVYRRVAL
jgi:hypothetical protein